MNLAIKKRISRRNYTKIPVSYENILKIKTWVNEINERSGLDIEFIEDGGDAFKNFKKSYGVFTNVRSILVMKGKTSEENLRIKIGYYGEELVLKLTDLDLGACWVGVTYDASIFTIEDGEELVCVIPFGNIENSIKDKALRAVMRSKNRKNINSRIISDSTIPQFVVDGMEAVKLAPSAVNKQSPVLNIKDEIITMSVNEEDQWDLVNLGIAMLHFEIGAKNGSFHLENGGRYVIK